MKIYVGNFSYDVTEGDLREAFAAFGEVASVSIGADRVSGQSRGFAFVEMQSRSAAQSAINELNGKEFKGRELNVNEARPRGEGRGGGWGGGGGGRGRRGGGG